MGRRRKNEAEFLERSLQEVMLQERAVQVVDGEMGAEMLEETPAVEYVAADALADQLECPASKVELMALSEDRSEEWVRYNENGKMKLHPDVARIIEIKYETGTAAVGDAFSQYLRRINSYPLLTPEEEKYWADRYAEHRYLNDSENREIAREARDKLVNSNLRWVVRIGFRYLHRGWPIEDIVQEGNLGLIRAIDEYDLEKAKVSTYSTGWIKQRITRALMSKTEMVRIPEHKVLEINKMRRVRQQIWQEQGRVAGQEEIAERMGRTSEAVKKMENAERITTTSMDCPVTPDSETSLRDMLGDKQTTGPEKETMQDLITEKMKQALAVLNEQERRVIELNFGLDGVGREMNLQEIGRVLDPHVTRERVRQIRQKALKKLKRSKLLRGVGEMLEEE